jgi:hypothetical protein
MTSAGLVYNFFFADSKKPHPHYLEELVEYAFQTDHEGEILKLGEKPIIPDPIALLLKKFISYYQQNVDKLVDLVKQMQLDFKYHQFLKRLPKIATEIDEWYETQRKIIQSNKIIENNAGFTIVSAMADLRSGEITKYLQDLEPNKDLYVGLSLRDKYMNIRTKHKVANLVAENFKGGGHDDRAGFPVPEEYLVNINQFREDSKTFLHLTESITKAFLIKIKAQKEKV